ncbi:SDR family NAD(P)-dependent oxidoreductase [Arthrobacter alpinus]|nr:SDR family NAD(P)-dependent oxidoreductase [Arthrobacter alpinus]
MDLGSQESVKRFAAQYLDSGRRLDILINNAAIMACPETRVGPGWEAQFATNHLGHFTLVNELWPVLSTDGARVVALSSTGHKRSGIHFDDPQFMNGYDKWEAYGQAKTANSLLPWNWTRSGRRAACEPLPSTPAAS